MSAKECPKGHTMGWSEMVCPICGERPILFDGLSRGEYNRREAAEEKREADCERD